MFHKVKKFWRRKGRQHTSCSLAEHPRRNCMLKKTFKEQNLGFPRFLTTELQMKTDVTTVSLPFHLHCFGSTIWKHIHKTFIPLRKKNIIVFIRLRTFLLSGFQFSNQMKNNYMSLSWYPTFFTRLDNRPH